MIFLKRKSYLLLLTLILFSCVNENDVDFSQTDDVNLTPEFTASLITFTLTYPDFEDTSSLPITTYEFKTSLDVFRDSDIENYLLKVKLNFEFDNDFNNDFEFSLNFLDDSDNLTHSISVNVDNNSELSYEELIEGADLQRLITTTQVHVKLSVINATLIDSTPGASFKFKSSATLFLEI